MLEVPLPEGDTIFKLARRLRPLLAGQRLEHLAFRGRRSESVPSHATITALTTVGKHLLIHLDQRRILRVHLGLKGAFRRLGPTEPLPSDRVLSLLLQTANERIVCVRARTVELFGAGLLTQHPVLSSLGPDLLVTPIPWREVTERIRVRGGSRTISDVLLDQRIAAGLGNVFRNDLLFLHGLHPDLAADSLPVDTVLRVYSDGARQLSFNLDSPLRITTRDERGRPLPGLPRHWVYGRAGQDCLRCGARLVAGQSREDARPTTACPRCQPAAGPPAPPVA